MYDRKIEHFLFTGYVPASIARRIKEQGYYLDVAKLKG